MILDIMKVNLQDGERVLYKEYPQKAILVFWFFKALFYAAIISSFIARFVSIFSIMITRSSYTDDYFLNFILFFIILLVVAFAYQIALLRSYTFHITNERVILFGGILLRKIKNVPYHKITDVSITQNIIERMLGISTLNVHTAGTGAQRPEIRFFGIRDPEKPQSIVVNELRAFKASSSHSSAIND